MNSHNINYNNKSEIILYLGQILHEFDDFNKSLCGDKYVSTDIPYIINELITKINDIEIFEIIFKIFEMSKIYIKCIDVDKFIATSYKWNIRQIHFDLSGFIKSQLETKIKNENLINKIVNNYLHTLILNIEFALCNFNLILKNIIKNYSINSNSNLKINDSKYKLSFKCDLNPNSKNNSKNIIGLNDLTESNKNELENKFKMIISDAFYVLRKLLSSSTYHLKLINEKYESLLTEFIINHLPYQYYPKIISVFECVELYIQCINLDKLINETQKMNIHSINIDFRKRLLQFIGISDDASKNAFIKSLNNKLENIFKCIDYGMNNPRTILNNARVFVEFDSGDDIFGF